MMVKRIIVVLLVLFLLKFLMLGLYAENNMSYKSENSTMCIVEAPNGSWHWVTTTKNADGSTSSSILVTLDPKEKLAVSKDIATKTRDFFVEGMGALIMVMLAGGYRILAKRIESKVDTALCEQSHITIKENSDDAGTVTNKVLDALNKHGEVLGRIDERLKIMERML